MRRYLARTRESPRRAPSVRLRSGATLLVALVSGAGEPIGFKEDLVLDRSTRPAAVLPA